MPESVPPSQMYKPGTPAGIDHLAPELTAPAPGAVRIRVIDISEAQVQSHWAASVDELLAAERPAWATLRWIDVDGLHPYVVSRLQQGLGLHTLAAEDALHTGQRARVDSYGDHLFVVTRMFSWRDGALVSEQVSMFVQQGLLVSLQQLQEDVWNPIRARLGHDATQLRKGDASYLAYALLDATVDHCFPILERYAERLEELEEAVLSSHATELLQQVHAVKRELTMLRKGVWPMREVVAELSRDDQPLVSAATRTYLRDVYQHCVQLIDILETHRELAASLTELSLSVASHRMNEIVKVLTILSTVFIPITFLAGVYGMNFDHLPELHFRHSYALFWGFCAALSATLLWYFKRKGWLGD